MIGCHDDRQPHQDNGLILVLAFSVDLAWTFCIRLGGRIWEEEDDTGCRRMRDRSRSRVSLSEDVEHWIEDGDIASLEELLLTGKAYLLENKDVTSSKASGFLRLMPIYRANIECMLEAVCIGNKRAVQDLMSYRKCVAARHPFTMCSTIHLAVIHQEYEIMNLLLSHPDAPFNTKDIEGRTPLHYAGAIAGSFPNDSEALNCYELLLKHGVLEMTVDMEGYTALDYKRTPKLMDMDQVKGLNRYPLDIGDDIDKLISERNENELSKIILAGKYDKIENRIFPPQSRDLSRILKNLSMRCRAVHQAILDDDFILLKQLIDSEEMATCRDSEGRTSLHIAVINGKEQIVRYILLLFPNSVDLVDNSKHTAFYYANQLEDQNQRDLMLEILRKAGANEQMDNEEMDATVHLISSQKRRKSESIRTIMAANSVHSTSDDMFDIDEDENVDETIEQRILAINFDQKLYRELEDLQYEGKNDEIWKVVKKHLGNEKLIRYVYSYRQVQNRLVAAIQAVNENDLRKLKSLLDLELVQIRDNRGLTILHWAVIKERHEMVEHIAKSYPKQLDTTDQQGRSAAHYAAVQQNAIYDTLVDGGANVYFADKRGFTASRYRTNPDMNLRPASPQLGQSNSSVYKHPSLDDTVQDTDAPSEEKVERWLAVGDIQSLEQLVLDGRSHLLMDKKAINLSSTEFLDGLPQYQAKIDAIHKAVEEGDVRRVKSLIDRSQLSTARDRNGMTPLHKALLYGQTNTVRYLLAKYPQCVNSTDHAGRTALHYAAADPNGEHMIKVLQKSGGDAFIEDKYGHTPFYYRTHGKGLNIRTLKDNAVINQLISGQLNRPLLQDLEEDISDWIHTGNVGKLEELVLNGYADLLLGRTHQVDDADAVGFLEVLPQYQAKIGAIHKAIEQGNIRAVKLLTDRKKLALCRDSRGLAPLHKAIVFGRTDIAKYLIRNYPQSVNAMDQNKRTPLHYAAALRDGGYLYKLMRKAGADPNIFDCNGRPAKYYLRYPGEINLERMKMDTKQALKQVLHNRVAPSYLETNIQQWMREGNLAKLDQLVLSGCGDLLIDKKANNSDAMAFVNELPGLLDTISQIHKAIKDGDIGTVRRLMTTKRLALARDRHGCTPLHTAIIYEQTEIIRFIAAQFPSVLNAPDYNKRTAMHYAAAARDGGHYLKILGKAGADPMAVDNEGRTPDYYRRNAVFDLKLLKEREDDFDVLQEHMIDEVNPVDSPPSPETMSLGSSILDSGRRDIGQLAETEPELDIDDLDDPMDDDMENMDRRKFEKLVEDKMDIPTSDNGLYLARTVAPVLTKALAEVLLRRPADPIDFISDWLLRYNEGKDNGHDY
uniref:ANK_REP_REGION domain-containing protein n=2 Tax=Bursaphelenchus xylophilus TaxID=6326 RepID=A0A1I7SUJ5_BURXY